MDKQDNLHKELDLIQGQITRMSGNSFLIKGWTMTLMSALTAFGKETILNTEGGAVYLFMMLAILIPFWWLDAYFLKQERLFRKVYEKAIMDPEATNRIRYDLRPLEKIKEVHPVRHLMVKSVISWFYLPFVILIIAGIILKLASIL
ncbi:MAG: hypothetical protein JSU05_13480 [Bacteroidetes bacterium]|nr:hypothetical protein [Bacteroidota bacterium]